jgi:hypothetical protein
MLPARRVGLPGNAAAEEALRQLEDPASELVILPDE